MNRSSRKELRKVPHDFESQPEEPEENPDDEKLH